MLRSFRIGIVIAHAERRKMRRSWYCNAMRAFASVLFFLSLLPAADQQFFELKDVRLGSGAKLAACRIGYRTFGALNAAQDNAIIFPTWFSGNSADLESFFGRMKPDERSQV